jgi:hypothetical protein
MHGRFGRFAVVWMRTGTVQPHMSRASRGPKPCVMTVFARAGRCCSGLRLRCSNTSRVHGTHSCALRCSDGTASSFACPASGTQLALPLCGGVFWLKT